jgi:NADH dehydrogenase
MNSAEAAKLAWSGPARSSLQDETGSPLPQLGSVAQQAGQHAARNVLATIRKKRTEAFRYRDKGTMAMIARNSALIQFRSGRSVTGKPAFLAWRAIHAMLLGGGEQTTGTVLEWGRRRLGTSKRRIHNG